MAYDGPQSTNYTNLIKKLYTTLCLFVTKTQVLQNTSVGHKLYIYFVSKPACLLQTFFIPVNILRVKIVMQRSVWMSSRNVPVFVDFNQNRNVPTRYQQYQISIKSDLLHANR